jgi:branched-subunit amino acid aminotransferase/4-amino-4-deoxychorismate lyase
VTLLAVAVDRRGLVDPGEPVFSPDDEAVVRGAAAFETVRIRRGGPVLLERHLERLARSSHALRLPPPEGALELARQAVAAAGVEDGALRLFRTSLTLVATVAPPPPGLEALRQRGLTLITIAARGAGLLAGVKATSYATNMAALAEAERRGADDALFVGADGVVLEATTSNVWWRDGDVLSTPSLATGVLPGVTRGVVIGLAGDAGLRVREGVFALAELLGADEAFTSSAVREVMPVVGVDGREIPRGEAATSLQALLEQLA